MTKVGTDRRSSEDKNYFDETFRIFCDFYQKFLNAIFSATFSVFRTLVEQSFY